MDGWMMDGWMDGWADGWAGGWMDGWMGGWMGGWVGGWMDGWMDGWIEISEKGGETEQHRQGGRGEEKYWEGVKQLGETE